MISLKNKTSLLGISTASSSQTPNSWNPNQYEKFKTQRSRPFFDLVSNLNIDDSSTIGLVLDLGCGTGELSKNFAESISAKKYIGMDSSFDMLSKHSKSSVSKTFSFDNDQFSHMIQGDFQDFAFLKPIQQSVDVLISNAALHWSDINHHILFPRLFELLNPKNGRFLFQFPNNEENPSHLLANEIAKLPKYASELNNFQRVSPVLTCEEYAKILHSNGFQDEKQNVYSKIYVHPMESSDSIVSWVKGSLLTAFQQRMSPETYDEFLKEYSDAMRKHFGQGEILYTYRRIFVCGTY